MISKGILCFIKRGDEVLLLDTDYGNGNKVWNGVSGYVEPGELMEDAVLRETKEEIGIDIEKTSLVYKGCRVVSEELTLELFTADRWSGVPVSQEESIKEVRWFKINDLPFDAMFPGNKEWVPGVLV